MKRLIPQNAISILLALFLVSNLAQAQSPGLLVKPKNGIGITFLNPDGDKFTAKTSAGFVLNDVTESEISFKTIPSIVPEPTGDNNGGITDGASDFVQGADGSGCYVSFDGTYVIFRFRVGGKSKGARGYSILLDTDLKIGSSGFYADPNYVAQTTQRSGNPGFELEVVYAQGKGVQILNVDGTVSGTVLKTYTENNHAQTSVALSKAGGDADYFIDFGVPATDLGIGTQYVRLVGTTCNSAASALNNNASDVWGINDIPKKALIPNWTQIINAQCGIGVTDLTKDGPGICICTPAPVVNSPIAPGTNVAVTGTWNRISSIYSASTSLTLYRNGTAVSTITASSGATWSVTLPSLQTGDTLWATAVSAPEQQCGTSNKVAVECTVTVPQPTMICGSDKGLQGTIPLGATVDIYEMAFTQSTTGQTTNEPQKLSAAGMVYTDGASNRTFSYYGTNTQSGSPCSGRNEQLPNTNYFLAVSLNGCVSQSLFICVTSSGISYPAQSSTLALTTPIFNGATTLNGTGGSLLGKHLKVYRLFLNGSYVGSTTSNTGSYSFSGLAPLKTGDKVVVYEATEAIACQTYSPTVTVQCSAPAAPTVNSTNGEILVTETSISGYSSLPGATVNLYRSGNPAVLAGTSTVNSAGEWLVSGLTLKQGEMYYATQSREGCTSVASATVTIEKVNNNCPTISGTYTESATAINVSFASLFTGTLKLFNNKALVKTLTLSNVTSYAIPVNQDLTYFTDVLTPQDTLTLTTEIDKGMESDVCAFCVIGCDMPPAPVASPTAITLNQGQLATFTLATTSGKALYSVIDGSNNTFATSIFGTGGSISIPTYVFNNTGTYNLKIAADNIEGPECRTTQDVVVTVNGSTLPLKFVDVAVKSSSSVNKQLQWIVASEQNISHYVVERSFDGSSFAPVALVSYRASSEERKQYSFNDALPGNQKLVSYRIKAVSKEGAIFYSKVVSLTESKNLQVVLAPNPARSETTLYLDSEKEQLVKIDLLDIAGRPILSKQVKAAEGRNAIVLDNLNKLARGQYILKLKAATGIVHLKMILE